MDRITLLMAAVLASACRREPSPSDGGTTPTDTDTGTTLGPTGQTGDTGPTGTGHTGALAVPDVWVSAPVRAEGLGRIVGSPLGWLLVDGGSRPVTVQRVAPDGALVDPAPVELNPYSESYVGLWTGTEFAVVAAENEDYYERTATLELRRIQPTGPITPVAERLGEGLGWPRNLVGACDGAGACVLALEDIHQLSTGETLRLSFDVPGSTAGPAPIAAGELRSPMAAIRDAGRTALVLSGGAPELVWLPDDPALSPESPTDVPGTAIAGADDGTVLVAWSHYDGDGDSGAPLGTWSVRAARAQYGAGLLDAAPIELGSGTLMDVAFDGTTFVVGLFDDGTAHLVRVGVDGVVDDRVAVPEMISRYGELEPGAPGHLLWGSTWTRLDPFFVRVEMDVPEGGACSDDASCLSGACDAGLCAP